jgi:hypothetical protein
VSAADVTLAARNLRLWTNYEGADPEVQRNPNEQSILIDNWTVPPTRRYVLRFNVQLVVNAKAAHKPPHLTHPRIFNATIVLTLSHTHPSHLPSHLTVSKSKTRHISRGSPQCSSTALRSAALQP